MVVKAGVLLLYTIRLTIKLDEQLEYVYIQVEQSSSWVSYDCY